MKLFVTGGCGFIGANFIKLLHRERPEWSVVNFDLLTYAGIRENLAELENTANYAFYQGDIADRQAVEEALDASVDAVVNFAAESFVDRSIVDASPFVRTNILGTQVLLDVARERGVKRFVQISTDEVYGSLGAEGLFTETMPLVPNSPYSASKAAADLMVLAAYETHGFPALITRCSNNYGPLQFPEKLIPLMIILARAEEPLPVYGEGLNVRDWIYVTDHCRGVLAALEKGKAGEVYNFGSSNEWTNIDLVKHLLDLLGKPHELIKFVKDRPGHDLRYAIDSSKAEGELGWKPQVSFTEGVQTTIDWYVENHAWWAPLLKGDFQRFADDWYKDRK